MACGRSVKLELEAFSGGGVTEFQEVLKASWKLENTAPSDIVMGFTRLPRWTSNTMRCGKSPLFRAARPLRIWMDTALVRHGAQTETVVVVEIGALLLTESATLTFVAATDWVSPVVEKCFQSAPVVEYVLPTPVVTYAHVSLVAYVRVVKRTTTSTVVPTSTAPITSPRGTGRAGSTGTGR